MQKAMELKSLMETVSTPTLELRNICKKFGEFTATDKVSFTADIGEFVTLLGPSGCGKTTLLKMIGGFHDIDSGNILLGGTDITAQSPEQRSTAMCFQSYALFPHLSVSHNIVFGLVQKNVSEEEQQQRLKLALEQVGLTEHKDKMPAELSGGQQQRVALARAMVVRPDVILFDEPLSNLDAKLRESVRYEIKELQQQFQLTAIYVTHDQAEALAMSDKIVVLNKGRIEQIGSPEQIYHHPANRFVADFIGAANIHTATVLSTPEPGVYRIQCVLGEFIVNSENAPAAERCYICWRPEEAEPVPESGENVISVEVTEKAFLGNMTDLFGCINGETVRIQLHRHSSIQQGEKALFKVPAHCIRFLEEATS
ncbi:ABC transporter ATP-binding protein [Grimontia sp. NTOU-MAR1]|uniref:ABC transporter ATP-binding protein n=1 Tax=Grimontia sp. NTOU-MAR1 TaxID=3111011 RepID=UPI002DBBEBFA|nr:ABC transporter ATP-binding protein [Grimontia sp. NTOU-MAR1]WRW00971.1 ABC transporter ATP-binding protein [Grimontia sp. NTOU-MAR1]